MLDRAPSVVITSNRNELKLYTDNTVFLNDGDNFELRFFNPLQEKIGVEIMFNGLKKGDGYLVLNPGQDLILDRFLDEQRKMLFETYVVNGNSQEAVEAIEQNGVITFNFYKEYYSRNVKTEVNINYNFPPKPIKYKPIKYKNVKGQKGLTRGFQGSVGTMGPQGCAGVAGTSGSAGNSYYHLSDSNNSFSTFTTTNANSRIYNSPGVFLCETDMSFMPTSTTTSASFNPLETGRVEKGDISSQTLKTVNSQFAETAFHTVTYKIMPVSALNKTIGEVREYCTGCGYRIRKNNWTFCPKCGSKLQ
jgi:hypothetical protein